MCDLQAAIERIVQMEQIFDEVLEATKSDSETICADIVFQEKIKMLSDYLESGLWLHDYECDERGELPEDLKRGVLSQDALYDLLCENMKCQRMEKADEKKEEVNAAVESTLDLMKYYEKTERRRKVWSLVMGGIGVLLLCVGIYMEIYLKNIYKSVSMNAAIGIIGGADGPTSVFVATRLGDNINILPWIFGVGILLIVICAVRLLRKRK